MSEQIVFVEDLGMIDYQEAWEYQTSLLKNIVHKKRLSAHFDKSHSERHHALLLCSHPHIYTMGKSGSDRNLLIGESELNSIDAQYLKINRGGDITYHGPGQLIAYPILDLDGFFHDVHRYVRNLEEIVIRILALYGLEAYRRKQYTGVWLDRQSPRKICAIGVHMSRWVTMHGLALNINTNMNYFKNIIPCGISQMEYGLSSLREELKKEEVDEIYLKKQFVQIFSEVFACRTIKL